MYSISSLLSTSSPSTDVILNNPRPVPNTCKDIVVYNGNAFSIVQRDVLAHQSKKIHLWDQLGPLSIRLKMPSISDMLYKTGFEHLPTTLECSLTSTYILKEAFNSIPQCNPSDENVFLTTNEENQSKTYATMKREKLVGNTFLAVSSFFGLNMAAARGEENGQGLDFIIMIDCSKRVESLWKAVEEIVKNHDSREEAFAAIKKALVEKSDEFWKACSNCQVPSCKSMIYVSMLEEEVASGISWLSSQKRYDKIKSIFDKDHFIFTRLDFFDPAAVRSLANVVTNLKLNLDTVYLSNLREYAEDRDFFPQFQASVHELRSAMTNQTLLIDTLPRLDGLHGSEELTQRVSRKVVQANIQKAFPPSPSQDCDCPFCASKGPAAAMIEIPLEALLSLMNNGRSAPVRIFFPSA